MRKNLFFIFLLVLVFSFGFTSFYRMVENDSFKAGESYKYKIKYGIFTVGEALVDVDNQYYMINNRPCYKVNVIGRTAGMTNIFKIKNTYRTYLDTSAFIPQRFIYSARENNFKRDQVVHFFHDKNEVIKIEKEESKTFQVPKNIQDVVSGYYFLRTIDYSKMQIGSFLTAPLFFDEELYNMKIKYAGRGTINTKFGKLKVIKLNPILPKNDLFKSENAIRIWVSDDKNKVPLLIEADFSIGTIQMEIKNYQGVKYPFSWS